MKITKLKLKNFRSITSFDTFFNSNKIIIIGENGIGKTTVVESIYYCCFLTSFKIKNNLELMKFNSDITNININFNLNNNKNNNLNIYFTEDKRNIIYNNINNKKRVDIIGKLKVLMLSPNSDEYVSGSPKIRRRYLDMYISQYNQKYSYLLLKYFKILKQRNNVLKMNKIDFDLLDILTNQYDELIKELRDYRVHFLTSINNYSKSIVFLLSSKNDVLNLKYSSSKKIPLEKEIKYKKSLYGLQYDDFEINLNNKSAKKYASQGEKRSISIALILSQIELIKNQINDYPIVIIDDVHIELDQVRRDILFSIISDEIQIFYLSTNLDNFPEDIRKNSLILDLNKTEKLIK